jgi:signal transduction histidine kinase
MLSMAPSDSRDVLADFAHQLRQPLSAMEALACHLDLIAAPEDARVHEQVRRMHAEIARTDQVLRDGLCTLRAFLLKRSPVPADDAGGAPKILCQPEQY